METSICVTLPILSCVTMWEKLHLRAALVRNYNDGTDLFPPLLVIRPHLPSGYSMLAYFSFSFSLFFYTNRCFDLVNSALGVNTGTNGTNSGCNPALGQKHAVWISSTPTSQPEHWRSQWGLAAHKPPSSCTYYSFKTSESHKKRQPSTTRLHPCENSI